MLKSKSIIFIVGPTAVGKSSVAVELARRIKGEIISCDSMQIYQGMEIITSKPSVHLRGKIKHHMIGVVSAEKEFNAAKFRKAAVKKVEEVIARGRVPIFVGGTGLYVSTLIDGIFEEKNSSPDIREKFYKLAKKYGNKYLYAKLKKADSSAAKKIHPHDAKRVIRALEVFAVTGKPISRMQKKRKGLGKDYNIKIFALNMDRDSLYKKIDERVQGMFKAGLIKEVKALLGKNLSKTSRYAIGIRELSGYFQGRYDLEEAKRLMKRNSRHYAKRQLTWFRKNKRINWINIKDKDTPFKVARRLWKELC
ncbi:MAG: tRNA (adenosine(37)-N6)-dimethylallyltransferase MiaA [Candidatus Omnitrophica bacterium]|nr:tRNA (adenosine(37)-N6)-dimethylallyltransferase MiaA [Candidatus Omnitrophota bacterium]